MEDDDRTRPFHLSVRRPRGTDRDVAIPVTVEVVLDGRRVGALVRGVNSR
ncbi:hypothetical protein [Streptomyces albidoflavus]